jgi:hypothetical protein
MITPIKAVINHSLNGTPVKIIKKIRIPNFKRPKSAQMTFNKTDTKTIRLNNYQQVLKAEEIRPWSKSTSPFHSRPASGDRTKKKIEIVETRIPTASNAIIQDTSSSFMTEQQNLMTGYELVNGDYIIPQITPTPTPKETQVFATEIPSYLHQIFPKRKIKRASSKPSSTQKNFSDFPTEGTESKSKIPSKVCYFNLKRRYYPVKFKLNYIPRHSSPFRPFLKRKAVPSKILC